MTSVHTINSIIKKTCPVEDGYWWVKQHLAAPWVEFGIVEARARPSYSKMVYALQDVTDNILDINPIAIANHVWMIANHLVREFEWQRSQWGRQNQLPEWVDKGEFWDQWFDQRRDGVFNEGG